MSSLEQRVIDQHLAAGLSPTEAAAAAALAAEQDLAIAHERSMSLQLYLAKAIDAWCAETGVDDLVVVAQVTALAAARLLLATERGDWTRDRIRGLWPEVARQALATAEEMAAERSRIEGETT